MDEMKRRDIITQMFFKRLNSIRLCPCAYVVGRPGRRVLRMDELLQRYHRNTSNIIRVDCLCHPSFQSVNFFCAF